MSPGAGLVLVKVGGAKSVLMFASPASPAQADRRQSVTQGYTPPGVHTALATPAPPRGFNTTHKLTKRSFEMATSCILSHFG